ncbi:MAG: hypothetical protein R2942_16655 [Ignavibacteria bacterium]
MSNLAASVITFIILIPLVLRNMDLTFNKELVSELLRFFITVYTCRIAANIVQIIDRPILKYLTDDKTVGIYQANYRLGIFMMLIVAMFEYAWRPFFLNNAKEPNAKSIFSKVLTYFLIGGSLVFLIITVFINDVVKMDLPFGFHLIEVILGRTQYCSSNFFAYLLNGLYVNLIWRNLY